MIKLTVEAKKAIGEIRPSLVATASRTRIHTFNTQEKSYLSRSGALMISISDLLAKFK